MTSDTSATTPIELLRRIENLLRQGTIHSVNHDGERVRVQSGEICTNWLPWFERRAGNVRSWSPPSVGEQCLVLSPGGELASGMVLVGLNSDSHPAPSDSPTLYRTEFPDGAFIDYDFASHALVCTLPDGGSGVINAPDSITVNTASATVNSEQTTINADEATINATQTTINAELTTINSPQTTITGACLVKGVLSFTAGMAGSGSAGGGAVASFSGEVESTGDMVASGISLTGHKHSDVQTGQGQTGGPV